MKNHFTTLAIAASLAVVFNPVHADNNACKSIQLTDLNAHLKPADCATSGALSALQHSGQFSDVFAAKKYIFTIPIPNNPPVNIASCYVSDGSFSGSIDGNPVTMTTVSAWTNDTKPVIFYGLDPNDYTDNLGAVITQVSIFDSTGKFKGNIYSRDVVDLSNFQKGKSIEQDTIVGGSKRFSGAQGTFRIESHDILDPSVSIPINVLKGTICTNGELE